MKKIVIATLLVAAPAMAQHKPVAHRSAPAAAKPVFSMFGQRTDAPATSFQLGTGTCTPATTGKMTCTASGDVKIGNASVSIMLVDFNNGRLSGVAGETGEDAFLDILSAFTAKYGDPNAKETRKWQNKAGAVFDNPTFIWHFKGGDLTLSQMGTDRDDCSFEFIDATNLPPSEVPKVNF